MPRLVDAKRAAARQRHPRQSSPVHVLDRGAHHAPSLHLVDERADVVAQRVELVAVVPVGRVDRNFGGWQGEDQPPAADVGVRQAERVTQEGPVALGIVLKMTTWAPLIMVAPPFRRRQNRASRWRLW